APYHPFERAIFFEGCLPIEEMAARGKETLRFGPMKPVGLPDPRTGRIPHAVVQLRQDNAAASLYNLVGFQSKLKWPEQQRVFRLIPGLERAEFVRYGSLHRNTYVNAPMALKPTLQCKKRGDLFLAGQITGVEGYVESAATGLLAGVNAARLAAGELPCTPPATTALGAILRYVTTADAKDFQPMNINFGLLPPLPQPVRHKEAKRHKIVERARRALEDWMEAEGVYAYSH
ncbi:MAG: methylenetetrahydrofolate--tRNA-(uracil(54)-C(5))-methyltransferase (FADH(2)-oxidizing) TrmFO, partial [Nitrospirae bacterium]|nr:methylenetetrahydrofolate--tRNA-(uracil(54)-C(5))-methyltransferase (FADH(2)-oxidizing) TrmFO [Nitrospirota bacterium]